MSVELEIRDGTPWYLSTDIWTVPGSDPEAAPGIPIVGEPCFMWARVRNNGRTAVNNAQVRFYWANPSVGFDRNTANFIGSANVSLAAGEQRDVLCLTPWVPVFVNGGHECVLAEAFHPTADPLPATPAFDVIGDRHVAQRNLQVVLAARSGSFKAAFSVCNGLRTDQVFTISARPGRLQELKPLLKSLGHDLPLDAKGEVTELGFAATPNPDDEAVEHKGPVVKEFPVKGGICSGLTLVGQLKGEAALVHIVQERDGKEVGGLSVLVLSPELHAKFQPKTTAKAQPRAKKEAK